VRPMQDKDTAGNQGARSAASGTSERLLADTEGVVVEVHVPGGNTAWLRGLTGSRDLQDGGVTWTERRYRCLNWTHLGARLRLEGASPQSLLGALVFVYGKERPVYHPQPGYDEVVLGIVHENVDDLPLSELFLVLHRASAAVG